MNLPITSEKETGDESPYYEPDSVIDSGFVVAQFIARWTGDESPCYKRT